MGAEALVGTYSLNSQKTKYCRCAPTSLFESGYEGWGFSSGLKCFPSLARDSIQSIPHCPENQMKKHTVFYSLPKDTKPQFSLPISPLLPLLPALPYSTRSQYSSLLLCPFSVKETLIHLCHNRPADNIQTLSQRLQSVTKRWLPRIMSPMIQPSLFS